MKITLRTADRLELKGIPGGRGAMWACTLIGAGMLATVLAFAIALYREQGWGWPHLAMGFGAVIAGGILMVGLVTLAVARERLVLDRTTGRVTYEAKSPIVTAPKPFEAGLESIDSVVLDYSTERRRSGDSNTEKTLEVWKAVLRVSSPRRSVVMDETENHREARVRVVAEEVASFLGLAVTETVSGRNADTGESSVTAMVSKGTPAGDRPDDFEGNDWRPRSVPQRDAAELERHEYEPVKPSAAGAVGCLLIVATFLAGISGVFVFGAWQPEATFNDQPIELWQRWLLTTPGGVLVPLVGYAWLGFFKGRHRITVGARETRYAFVMPGSGLFTLVPGLGRLSRGLGRSVPTDAITSIKAVTRRGTRVVEIRTASDRIVIPSQATEQRAKASMRWLAASLRHDVRQLGA